MPICVIEGCVKPRRRKSAEWCEMHYHRWYNHGDPLITMRLPKMTCSVDRCSEPSKARGWCHRHYQRWRGGGDPHGPRRTVSTGDNATYNAVHIRLRKQCGSATDYVCGCGTPATQWAYLHNDPNEKIDEQYGPYSTDFDYYDAMCVPCHKVMDLAYIKTSRKKRHRIKLIRSSSATS